MRQPFPAVVHDAGTLPQHDPCIGQRRKRHCYFDHLSRHGRTFGDFRERNLWNIDLTADRTQSALMPADLISLLSFSTISAGVAFGAADAVPGARLVAQELTDGRDTGSASERIAAVGHVSV